MRTLEKIIDSVRSNEDVDNEELKYALLAMLKLHAKCVNEIDMVLSKKPSDAFHAIYLLAITNDRQERNAYGTPPDAWIGWQNDPRNPTYQALWKSFKLSAVAIPANPHADID